MTHLHRYIEDNGTLYPEQLAEALRRQQIYGGSLDTVLLELELVEPKTLGELLERACGFPIVPIELLDNGLERPWEEIPEDLQRSRWVEPLAKEGGEILVAVHPDLPNELLGGLLRSVGRIRPMVTPECCLEKVAAERHGSVVPQRYAILCASYLSAIRRRPSISGVHPMSRAEAPSFEPPSEPTLDEAKSEPTSSEDDSSAAGLIDVRETPPVDIPQAAASGPADPSESSPSRQTIIASGAPPAGQGPGAAPSPRVPPPPKITVPEPAPEPEPEPAVAEQPPSRKPTGEWDPSAPLPSPSDEAQTPPAPAEPFERDEADVTRRLEQARATLEAARSRDDALEAIAKAAMVLSPRVGLFRARNDELMGLTTLGSQLSDIGGKVVAAPEGSAAHKALHEGSFIGTSEETDLQIATGIDVDTPCALQRVEVRGRAVVVVYLDRDGAPIGNDDREWLHDIAMLGGSVFEEILKLRRRSSGAKPKAASGGAKKKNPPTIGNVPERRWNPPSARVRAAYGDDDAQDGPPLPVEPTATSKVSRGTGAAVPPSLVPPEETPPEPDSWRLTPELAAKALEQQAEETASEEEAETPAEASNEEVATEAEPAPEAEPERDAAPSEDEAPEPAEETPVAAADDDDDDRFYEVTDDDDDDGTSFVPPAPTEDETSFADATPDDDEASSSDATPTDDDDDETSFADANPDDDDDDETSFAGVDEAEPAPEDTASTEAAAPEPELEPEPEPPAEPRATLEYEDIPIRTSLRPHSGGDEQADPEPRATLEFEDVPVPHRTKDITERNAVAAKLPDAPLPSERPTMELASGGLDGAGVPASEPTDAATESPEAEAEGTSGSSLQRSTVIPVPPASDAPLPPPPEAPLPPPPPSAVDEIDENGVRRPRSSTISGLPPPELGERTGKKRVMGNPAGELLPRGDEEVEIIPLAQPITPATARGRIELEDEDWMPSGTSLASDSQQGEIDAVIDAVVAGESDPESLERFGATGLMRLVAQFPGPLEVLRRDLRSLPPPSAHGPLIRTVIALRGAVVPHLIDLFEHPNPDVRFYAAFVFHELRDARCMRPLGKLAFDANGDVRIVSMRVLETYRTSEGFDVAASIVREQLSADNRNQQLHAARAAGTLRDIGAIPRLIALLTEGDRFIQEASLESLCSITGQQHGLKPHRWRAWYEEQGELHRVEWIIDSLRHRDLPVRRWAADELVRITGHRVPFSPMGDRRSREVAAKAWTDWWLSRGREMFGAS